MLEFKKKTRAHKWCNYAVYGLLTLSQLSKTGMLPFKHPLYLSVFSAIGLCPPIFFFISSSVCLKQKSLIRFLCFKCLYYSSIDLIVSKRMSFTIYGNNYYTWFKINIKQYFLHLIRRFYFCIILTPAFVNFS